MVQPAPTVVAYGEDSGSGTSVTLDLPAAPELGDIYIAHLLWITGTALPTTAATGWSRRRQIGTTAGSDSATEEFWTHTHDGSTTMVVTSSSSGTVVATFHVIDGHLSGGPSYQVVAGPNPQYAVDFRYHTGDDISPVEPQRLLCFDTLSGNNFGSGYAAPAAGPSGYTFDGSIIAGANHLHVAHRQTGITTIENPGPWTWSDWGTPEDDPLIPPNPGDQEFLPLGLFTSVYYLEFYPEAVLGPYWGILAGGGT